MVILENWNISFKERRKSELKQTIDIITLKSIVSRKKKKWMKANDYSCEVKSIVSGNKKWMNAKRDIRKLKSIV
jgi:hypothetical protein